jgi:hypothetical protein
MDFLTPSATISLGDQFENILCNISDISYLTTFMQLDIASVTVTGHSVV